MNTLGWLAVILLILMVLIGGRKGLRSFIALLLNFGILLLTIIFMTDPTANPIVLTLIGSTLICCMSLFFINKVNVKTKAAFLSTMVTIAILLFFIHYVTKTAMIQGFHEEEIDELSMFSLYISVDFIKIATAMIIMSTIGAIIDVAISISSSMSEMYRHYPTSSRKELFAAGLRIGKDILGSDTNTLFFAFFGGYMGLLIWFKDLSYSIGEIVNSKVFSVEMITILCAGIGIALVVPIASWISAYLLMKTNEKK